MPADRQHTPPVRLHRAPTPPPPPDGCAEAMAQAARLWLRYYGAPRSFRLVDAHFTLLAERVLWAEAEAMGLATKDGPVAP